MINLYGFYPSENSINSAVCLQLTGNLNTGFPRMTRHGYHLVQPRPWPLTVGLLAFSLAAGLVDFFHGKGLLLTWLSLAGLTLATFNWWIDVTIEATYLGKHTSLVYRGLRIGMLMFILSEAMFFFSFFWSYLYYSVVIRKGWPPNGIFPIYPSGVPLLNTVILVGSGFTLTWRQRCLSAGNREEALTGLALTVIIGVVFTGLQAREFFEAKFTIQSKVYGAIFFIITGFHGLHVIIGTVFLAANLARMYYHHYAPSHHFGFTAAAWYWHFVDVVWILLYLLVYCLGWHTWLKRLAFYGHDLYTA